MMKAATAIAAGLLVLSAAARADDFSVKTAPTGADKLPKKGSAVYEGQFVGTGPWVGVSGPIQLFADFGTGEMAADLTIPSLGSGNATSPPEHFTPVGEIVVNGKKQAATYTLTQGVFFSPDEPFIAINGSLSGKKVGGHRRFADFDVLRPGGRPLQRKFSSSARSVRPSRRRKHS